MRRAPLSRPTVRRWPGKQTCDQTSEITQPGVLKQLRASSVLLKTLIRKGTVSVQVDSDHQIQKDAYRSFNELLAKEQ